MVAKSQDFVSLQLTALSQIPSLPNTYDFDLAAAGDTCIVYSTTIGGMQYRRNDYDTHSYTLKNSGSAIPVNEYPYELTAIASAGNSDKNNRIIINTKGTRIWEVIDTQSFSTSGPKEVQGFDKYHNFDGEKIMINNNYFAMYSSDSTFLPESVI